MSHRQLSLLVIYSLLLSMGTVFAPQGVYAQRACTLDSECRAAPDLGAEFRCVQRRCNLPPPIWNAQGLTDTQAGASFNISGDGVLGGDFYLNSGRALRVDLPGAQSIFNIGNWGAGAQSIRVNIWGTLAPTTLCLGADCRNTWPAGTTWSGLTGFPAACTAGQFVTGVNTADAIRPFICADPPAAAGLTGGVAGKVPFWIDGDTLGQNTNFHWDNAAGRLGIGTAMPARPLDLVGDFGTTGDIYLSTTKALRIDGAGTTTLNIGNWAAGGDRVSISVLGELRPETLCLGAVCRTDWPVAAGGGGGGPTAWTSLTGFPADCGVSEYVAGVGTGGPLTCRTLPAAPGGGLTGVGTANKLAFWTGASTLGQIANLHFDSASGRMGIGTAAPSERLEVRDDTVATARLRITDTTQNPELQLKYGVGDTDHWAFFIDQGTQELRFWRGDNRFTLSAGGNLRVSGCLGPVVVGVTPATYNGDLNAAVAPNDGYRGADGLCNTAFTGAHQCATNEVMTSIHCGSIWTSAAKTTLQGYVPADTFVWISNGAPSLPTPTNDCYGWTETRQVPVGGPQSQGIAWSFDVAGGGGYARPCFDANQILCCR